ncbi:hypothetical protein L1987_52794 [Smallanthus sonchifolius]|uniref:Uncharacterized protein n=1 Tax=Smallanthus sonchifolius TaxID=185202 RepID=A0ACB9EUR6_9ASTR|nr:hypothetical protein L1987_52794 [Smallanthus sonchifolius]
MSHHHCHTPFWYVHLMMIMMMVMKKMMMMEGQEMLSNTHDQDSMKEKGQGSDDEIANRKNEKKESVKDLGMDVAHLTMYDYVKNIVFVFCF